MAEILNVKKKKKTIEWQPQQKEVINFSEKKDLIVFASAGSGKTTVMVEKLTRYLVDGGDINKIVVLTFTNNSANDMKEKIINALKEEINNTKDPLLADRLRKQIFDIPQSDIGTIDSFCNTIVQKYYETIGIPPGLSVLSSSEADALFDEAILLEIEERIKEKDEHFKEVANFFYSGRSLDKIKNIVKEIYKKTSSYPYPEKEMEKIKNSCSLEVLETAAFQSYIKKRQAIAGVLKEKLAPTKSLLQNQSGEILVRYQILEDILTAFEKDYVDIDSYVERIKENSSKIPTKLVAKDHKDKEERDVFNNHLKGIKGFVDEMKELFVYETGNNRLEIEGDETQEAAKMEFASRKILIHLVNLAQRIIERYNLLKANENKMTFSDLEGFALRILSEEDLDGGYVKSKIAEEITAEKDHIFIDEYQDTNYLQEMILSRISNNNVFMVGDIKQSIYMFRNSEPDIMKQKKEFYLNNPERGETKVLNDNFRSHEEILEFVNEVFSPIMTEEFGKVAYRREAKLTAPKLNFSKAQDTMDGSEPNNIEALVKKRLDVPSVTVKMFEKKDGSSEEDGEDSKEDWEALGGIYSLSKAPKQGVNIDKEAEWIANAILTMVGKEEVYDAKKRCFRKIEFEDIVILQRNRKTEAYASVFAQKGIPFEVVGGEGALLTDDINVLNSILKVISNPRQDYPLVMALTSFIGNLTMEDLLSIRKKRKQDSITQKTNASRDANENIVSYAGEESLYDAIIRLEGRVGNKCRLALAQLDKYRQHAHMMDVPSLLNKIVSETRFDAEMLSSPEERISSFNIYVEYLRGKEFSYNIESYLNWLEKDLEIDVKLPGSSANCVRMNTIHGSKGLEYPIVFFANSEQGYRKNHHSTSDIMFDKDLGIASKYVNVKGRQLMPTISYQSILERQEEREKEEQMRLLYVVLTRAKNRLFITGASVKKGVEDLLVPQINTFSKLIEYAALQSDIVKRAHNNYEPLRDVAQEINVTNPRVVQTDKTISFHTYKDYNSSKVHNKYAVTKMPSLGVSTTLENEEYNELIPVLVTQTKEVGTTYHQILEQIDLSRNSREEVTAQIDEIFLLGNIKTKVERSEINDSYIYQALNHEIFTSLKNMEVIREKAFALYLPYNEFVKASDVKDKVIVQGIIDMMGINGDDEVTIIDYKYSMSPINDIKIRYQDQMELYSMSVEILMNKKVVRRAIYVIPRNIVIDF